MVLDRLFLWMYTIASVIGSFVILLTAPALYDDSSDMAIKYSLVAQQLYGIPDFWMAASYPTMTFILTPKNAARLAQTMSYILVGKTRNQSQKPSSSRSLFSCSLPLISYSLNINIYIYGFQHLMCCDQTYCNNPQLVTLGCFLLRLF